MEINIGIFIAPVMIIIGVLFFYSVVRDVIDGCNDQDIEMRKDLDKESYERITGKKY